MLAQVAPLPLEAACGADPTFICREVLERTDSTWLAELADVVFAKPLSIALVLAGRGRRQLGGCAGPSAASSGR